METPSVTHVGSTTSSMGWVWWQVCEGVYFVKVWACEGMCIVEEDCKQRDIFVTTWISIFDSWFWVECFGSRNWNQKLRCAIATECSCAPVCVCVCFQWFGVGGEWVWWTWAVGRWIVCVIRSNMYLMYCCYEDNALHFHCTHVCVCYWNSFCYLCRTCCSQSPSPQSTWLANGLDKLLRSLSWHSVWWWSRN